MGVSMPMAVWRRRRLWKISKYSNRALASSMRVGQRRRLSSSVCTRPQKDSMTALRPLCQLAAARAGVWSAVVIKSKVSRAM